MNDSFEKKLRAAAVAGWWVLLIAYALLTVSWLVYRVLLSARPAWLLTMWGLSDEQLSNVDATTGVLAASGRSDGVTTP
jgi:hypothetical protein